ncbi:hypothetical protein MGU_09289 [Metarhizium guizhouense ARSEF 977]|uniref:Uncharacterized protein n=1 Tax=Metarhizium guizhouense (strain ARSEF 977) TaxID=1276136 RepID=A0A0B4GLC3_METGA|nr:hypothetical protein MGU_09289 [Metarhizium guizhouense ARSEF 977]
MVPSKTLFSFVAMLAATLAQENTPWKQAKNQLCFGRGGSGERCHYASDEGNLMSHIFPDEICIEGEINPKSWVDRIPECGRRVDGR